MRGARALLAFHGVAETEEALLGALMEADFQKTAMDFIAAYVRGNQEAAKRSKRRR